MPGFVAEKKRYTDPNMCFPNLANHGKPTFSKSNRCVRSEALDDDDDDSSIPILPGLPDDVSKHCLALVPRSNFPAMGGVSKRWRGFIRSKEFITVRKLAGMHEEWLYILTAGSEGKGSHWEVMDCLGHNRRSLPPMPGPAKAGFGVAVLNGKLLIMAGCSSIDGTASVSEEVYQYDSCLNSWSRLSSMNVARYDFACAEVNGLVYAVGGYGANGDSLSCAEVYDPDTNKWTPIESLRRPRWGCFACGFEGKLYVMGGRSNFTIGNSKFVDVYNPEKHDWCEMKNGCVWNPAHNAKLFRFPFIFVFFCGIGSWRRNRMMGLVTNLRGSRTEGAQQESMPVLAPGGNPKRKWSNLMPLVVAFVVIAEIAFLGRLDMAKNAAMVDTLADLFYRSRAVVEGDDLGMGGLVAPDRNSESDSCEEWLEREDAVTYSRDFSKDPVFVSRAVQEWKTCSIGCKFGFSGDKKPDAAFGLPQPSGTASVLRSMESAKYYAENNIAMARRRGYNIIMTTSLSSDVPVGYFSWAEYDMMAPVQPKTEAALAAAFISNCGARNFRLQALEALEKLNIKIDSYGGCHRNRDGRVSKVEALKHYKFSLAFENSNEEDYVTEKFFQSLVAGTVPVVVGAPNIQDFAPSPGSILHIKEIEDVESVAKTMRYLSENPEAYNQSLRWKYEGPSDSFKALVDMAAVHSSCRLCIHLATVSREKEEKSPSFKRRPCKCTRGLQTVYHIYVRERGRFEMESIYLRSGNLTLDSVKAAVVLKFTSKNHVPVWKTERPEVIRGGTDLKLYKIYPIGLTQRQALYTFSFKGDADFRSHLENNPCAKFEVIFV